jgi:predicted transposase/invertase (TIGR01784 family)
MGKYLDPTNDVAFKKVFSDKRRMLKFMNAILRLAPEDHIIDFTYITTEQVPDLGQLKRGIVDLKCEDKKGRIYIVEMQNGYADCFTNRLQLYGAQSITSQLKRGMTYKNLKPVVIIVLLTGFDLHDDDIDQDVIHFHETVNLKTKKCSLNLLKYVIVELDKFHKNEDELESAEDQWLYFMSISEDAKHPPRTLHDADIESAYECIAMYNWSVGELEAYQSAKMALDTEQLTRHAKYEQGKAEGRGEEKIAIARNLIIAGLSNDMIAASTKLSIEEVQGLRKEILVEA